MKKPRRGAGSASPDLPDPGIEDVLDQPETRMVLAGVALHGLLSGSTRLPDLAADVSQDVRPKDAAAKFARDAVAIADALIGELRK